MVGKIQDIVSASIVAGAAERVSDTSSQVQQAKAPEGQELKIQKPDDAQNLQNLQDAQNTQAEDKNSAKERDEREQMDEKSVSFMTKELNELMSKINCNLEFQYHKEVNMMAVKMLDKKTHEVLKEVPPEEMLEQMAKAREWLGAFLDKNA